MLPTIQARRYPEELLCRYTRQQAGLLVVQAKAKAVRSEAEAVRSEAEETAAEGEELLLGCICPGGYCCPLRAAEGDSSCCPLREEQTVPTSSAGNPLEENT